MVGAGRLSDIWANGNIWFVDGDVTTNGDGKSPDSGVALISTAVGLASKDASIYVKPRTTTGSAQTYYRDNISIPKTKPNMSIIGCGAGGKNPNSYTGVQLKVSAATTTGHLIDVQGGGLYLENLRLTGNSMTGTGSIVHANSSSTTTPGGLHINGCLFEYPVVVGSIEATDCSGGSIALGTATYVLIENCTFFNCLSSIHGSSTNGAFGRVQIQNNTFAGGAAQRDMDIYLTPGSGEFGSWVNIVGNVFSDGKPTAGTGLFIKIVGTTTGIIADNFFASTAASGATGWGAAGTEILVPTTFFFAGNFAADGHVAAA
jgi:hypothetical protein